MIIREIFCEKIELTQSVKELIRQMTKDRGGYCLK